MNDSLPGCMCDYPNSVYPNECDTCRHLEICKESTKINQKRKEKVKAELLEKIEECLDIVEGVTSQ